jgi:hypothetical protein
LKPDPIDHAPLQFDTGEMREVDVLIVVLVLVVDLKEELGERFLLREAGGTGLGGSRAGCLDPCKPDVFSCRDGLPDVLYNAMSSGFRVGMPESCIDCVASHCINIANDCEVESSSGTLGTRRA